MEKFVKADILIKKILAKYGIVEDINKLYIIWEKVVGEKLAKKIELCGVKGGTILVSVASCEYHHYLKISKREWLKKINDFFSSDKEGQENFKFNDIKVVKL